VVDDPDSVARAELGHAFQQRHELQALAVDGYGQAPSNSSVMSSGSSGASSGRVTS